MDIDISLRYSDLIRVGGMEAHTIWLLSALDLTINELSKYEALIIFTRVHVYPLLERE